jgi:hypothetical protein
MPLGIGANFARVRQVPGVVFRVVVRRRMRRHIAAAYLAGLGRVRVFR